MSAFDPYHKWLGIPPTDQPANHYRLLGLNLFESDPDVIDVATEQRVVYLRQCATGQHIAESQKLLNEVAAARLCLLNAQKKREYDQRLRQSLAAAQVPVQSTEPAPVMMPWESPSDERPDAVTTAVEQSPKRSERAARKNSSSAPVVFPAKRIAVVSGLLVVVVLGFVFMRGGSDPDKPASDDRQAASSNNDLRSNDENKSKPAGKTGNGSSKNAAGSTPKRSLATSDVPRKMAIGFDSRRSGSRQAMLASGGGTVESERAVAAALGWIARHQSPDGSWNCKHFSKQCTDPSCNRHVDEIKKNSVVAQEYPTAATAFGLLPYLAAGMTPESEGPYQDVIRKGLQWLTTNQDPKTGRLGTGNMYEHGLGTIAICEAYGLSKDAKLRPLAQAAVRFTEDAQNDVSGGWHYVANPPTVGDTSVLGWQFMSLRSAQMAGLQVNPQTLEKAQRYLRTVARGKSGGLSAYDTSAQPTPAMTAIGLLCRQYDGMRRSDPAMVEGMNYLVANPPHSAKNCYYWFYATQVIHNLAGPEWQDWNDRARELWIATQIKEGCAAGSWSVEGHGDVAGPLMITSLNALNLEVYYRNRPLYQSEPTIATAIQREWKFASEPELSADWDAGGKWRIENQGLRIWGGSGSKPIGNGGGVAFIRTKQKYRGDLQLEINYEMSSRCEMWVTIWGERFDFKATGKGVAHLERKGDVVTFRCNEGKGTVVNLKASQAGRTSPVLLHLDRQNLYRAKMELLLRSVSIQGQTEE